MTHTAHTPGPWTIQGDNEETYVFFTASNGKQYQIAKAFSGESSNASANARLIAAAPELLEALEAVKAEYDTNLADDERNFREYRMVCAAIDKARGQ